MGTGSVRVVAGSRTDRLRHGLAQSARAFSVTARNPGLLRAQAAFGAAWTADWIFTIAIGVVAFEDGGVAAVGLVAFARMAPSAVVAPFGAALGDRFPRDRVLLWSCLLRFAILVAAVGVLATDGPELALYTLAILATLAFTSFRPVHSALLPELCTTPFELTSANLVRGLLDALSTLVGPFIAALLLESGGVTPVFAISAAISLLSAVLLVGLPYEPPPRGPAAPLRRIAHETVDGFRALARHRDASLLIGLALVQSVTRGCFNVFVVVIAFDVLGLGAPGVGLLTAAVGAGAVAGSLGSTVFVTGRRLAALEGVGVAIWGLSLSLIGVFPNPIAVIALMVVIGVGNVLVDIGLHTLPARLVPDEVLARVFGAKESLTALAVALGSLATPLAIDLLGTRGALVALGLGCPLVAALAWRRLRSIDASIAYRDEEVEVLENVGMFRPLPMPAIDNLALNVMRAEVGAGEQVFRQGDGGDCFYVIEDGEAEVIGDRRLIRVLGPGEGFGEIALLRNTVRTTTVQARTPLRLYALNRRHFLAAVTGYHSSMAEADALVLDRLGRFDPGSGEAR